MKGFPPYRRGTFEEAGQGSIHKVIKQMKENIYLFKIKCGKIIESSYIHLIESKMGDYDSLSIKLELYSLDYNFADFQILIPVEKAN